MAWPEWAVTAAFLSAVALWVTRELWKTTFPAVTDEVRQMSSVVGVPVELVDERLTTVAADRILREGNLSASRRREHVDKVAAAVLLQTWLDGRAAR